MWKSALLPENFINIPWSCIAIHSEWSTLYLLFKFLLGFCDCSWALTWWFHAILCHSFNIFLLTINTIFVNVYWFTFNYLNFICLFTALQSIISTANILLICYSPFHVNFKYTVPGADVRGMKNPQVLMHFLFFFFFSISFKYSTFKNAVLSKMYSFVLFILIWFL